ncbi:hypothetical protein C7964_102973 [Loktanella sp. PT4BL]|jgi:hypothetical protein|nr:hypothetical protein C7964_102973 [Loktanella sp. PT4BL]
MVLGEGQPDYDDNGKVASQRDIPVHSGRQSEPMQSLGLIVKSKK